MFNSGIKFFAALSLCLIHQAKAAVDYVTVTTPDLTEFTQVSPAKPEHLTLVGRGFKNSKDEVFTLACVGKPIDANQSARDCHWLRFVYHSYQQNYFIANPFPVISASNSETVTSEDLRIEAIQIMRSIRQYSHTQPAKFSREDVGIGIGYGSMIAGGYFMISDYKQNASVTTTRFLTGAALELIGPAIWMLMTNGSLRSSLLSPTGIFDPIQNKDGWNWQTSPRKMPQYRFDLFKKYLTHLASEEMKTSPGQTLVPMPW